YLGHEHSPRVISFAPREGAAIPSTPREQPPAEPRDVHRWEGYGYTTKEQPFQSALMRSLVRKPRTSSPSVMGFRIFGGVKIRKPSPVSFRSQSSASGGGSVEARRNR